MVATDRIFPQTMRVKRKKEEYLLILILLAGCAHAPERVYSAEEAPIAYQCRQENMVYVEGSFGGLGNYGGLQLPARSSRGMRLDEEGYRLCLRAHGL